MSSHNALFVPAGTLFSFKYEFSCLGQTVTLQPSDRLDWPDEPMLVRVREPKAQLTPTHYVEAIHSKAHDAEPLARTAVQAHARLMMAWAHHYLMSQHAASDKAAKRLMRAFCSLIVQSEAQNTEGGRMADFAAKLGVTLTHLARVCKATCGVSAVDLFDTTQPETRTVPVGGRGTESRRHCQAPRLFNPRVFHSLRRKSHGRNTEIAH